MTAKVSIVLVEPERPGNIGAVARAMKNMGFFDLRLIRPPKNWEELGKKMAVQAHDILDKASVFSSVRRAVSDRQWVIATTRRQGMRRGIFRDFKQAIAEIHRESHHRHVAILFGKESKGLSNRDLAACDWAMTIPSHPGYPSINLAQAAMLVLFSLFMRDKKQKSSTKDFKPPLIPKKEIQEVLKRFKRPLKILGYAEEGGDVIGRILTTLHGLIKRGGLTQSEAQMIKGLSRRIVEKTSKS